MWEWRVYYTIKANKFRDTLYFMLGHTKFTMNKVGICDQLLVLTILHRWLNNNYFTTKLASELKIAWFNHVKIKIRLNYSHIKNHLLYHIEQTSFSFTKTKWLTMFREMNGVQCENHTKNKYTVWETGKMFKYSKRNTKLPFGFKHSICCVHSASRNVHHASRR